MSRHLFYRAIFTKIGDIPYNQQLRTMGEHFGGNLNSYMLMTTEFGVFFVNMNFNFVILLLHQKLILLV